MASLFPDKGGHQIRAADGLLSDTLDGDGGRVQRHAG
jgi:hypothetical protein